MFRVSIGTTVGWLKHYQRVRGARERTADEQKMLRGMSGMRNDVYRLVTSRVGIHELTVQTERQAKNIVTRAKNVGLKAEYNKIEGEICPACGREY